MGDSWDKQDANPVEDLLAWFEHIRKEEPEKAEWTYGIKEYYPETYRKRIKNPDIEPVVVLRKETD